MKHIDLEYLEQLANGSNEFMRDMIVLFMEQTPAALDKMEQYLREKDWKMLRGILHKIKPSVSFVGLKEIAQTVKEAEEFAGNEKNLEQLPEMIYKIKQACTAAIEELGLELKRFA